MAIVYVYGQERCWKQKTNIRIYTDPFSSILIFIILNCFCFLKTCICFYTNQYAACQREFLINCLGIYGFIPIQCASLSALMLYSLIKAYILLKYDYTEVVFINVNIDRHYMIWTCWQTAYLY